MRLHHVLHPDTERAKEHGSDDADSHDIVLVGLFPILHNIVMSNRAYAHVELKLLILDWRGICFSIFS